MNALLGASGGSNLRLVCVLAALLLCAVSAAAQPQVHSPRAPAIVRIVLSKMTLQAGDDVRGDVVTTPDVSRVNAVIIGQAIALRRVRPGHFEIHFGVPWIVPFFFKGTQQVEFVARNPAGLKATKSISFEVR